MSYLPFVPPNVGGFPKGSRLLGPSNLVHTFDLVQAVDRPGRATSVDDLLARFGVFDVSDDHPFRARRRARSRPPLRARGRVAGVHADMNARTTPRAGITPPPLPHRPRCGEHRRGRGRLRAVGVARRRLGRRVVAARACAPRRPRLGGRDDRTLVVVELAGGNDGLNTVVPMADPAYRDAAPDARRSPTRSRSTTRSGCTPSSRSSRRATTTGTSRSSRASGYPDPDLSHFASLGVLVVGRAGGERRRRLARSLPRRHGRVRRSARRGRHRAGAVARAARDASRSRRRSPTPSGLQPTLPGVGVDDRRRRPRRRVVAASRPRRPIPRTLMGEIQQAISSTAVRARAGRAPATAELRRAVTAGPSAVSLDARRAARRRRTTRRGSIYVNGLGDFDTHQGEAQRQPALDARPRRRPRRVLHGASRPRAGPTGRW